MTTVFPLYIRLVRIIIVGAFLALLSLSSVHGQEPGTFYYEGEKPIRLLGKWKFVADTFLTYNEVLLDTNAVNVNVPGSWNNVEWKGRKYGSKGYGTYYAKVIFDTKADQSDLALEIPEIGIAYKLYVNENLISSLGDPGKSKSQEKPKIDFQIIEMPPLNEREAYLILQISNFQYSYGGLLYPPKLGGEVEIRKRKDQLNTLKLLILGSVIILAIYMLYVYAKLRSERFRLYFAIVCIVLLLHTLCTGNMPIVDIFPGIGWVFVKKLAFVSFFLVAAANGMFLKELFPRYLNTKVIYILGGVSLVAVFFTILAPVGIGAYLVVPFQIISVAAGIYFFESLIRATYARVSGARFLLVGYAIALLAAINDMLTSQYILSTPRIVHYGMFAYILTMTLVMAIRYVGALRKNETIAESLTLANELLEKSVENRTRKLKSQNELIDSKNKELENALKEKDDLMAVVAHDLKAPFSQIHELSQLLKEGLKGDQIMYNDMIRKVTDNGHRVIDNLVFLRSYERESFKPEYVSIDPASFFDEKLNVFQTEAKKKKIEIEGARQVSGEEVLTDKSAVDRILDNLLSNAIKFSSEKNKVVFEMLEEKDEITFRVKDYGQGFSKSDKEKAFRKFQKLSAKPTGGELSSGLGLNIVKTLVEKLEGNLKLVSEKGKGAEFIVKIPKKKNSIL